ncbi:MAG TPA: hypothetical protein VED63_10280 [Acidimicrobiales bacterium]|nr:hypothetical protein [Acidimicrobiales bacterium]
MNFRLDSGADVASFLAADRQVQCDFAYQQAGLLRRTTARSVDGNWIVLDLWSSENEADACADHKDGHPVTAAFMSFIDASTVRIQRYTTLD